MQYFNKFICFLTFGILSLLYQITIKLQNMTQTELQNELQKLSKKALALSKKAYCGSEHSSLYSGRMQVIYDRIWELKAQLNNQ